MADEKDRFGDTMKLVERAKEDIYFAEHDRELLAKLREQLKKVDKEGTPPRCPKCPGVLDAYMFHDFNLDRCRDCGGIWMEKGELDAVIRKISRSPLRTWLDKLAGKQD